MVKSFDWQERYLDIYLSILCLWLGLSSWLCVCNVVVCGRWLQMLSTVLNIIMFEDCRNQWSMSRPLLGLILLNEEVNWMHGKARR